MYSPTDSFAIFLDSFDSIFVFEMVLGPKLILVRIKATDFEAFWHDLEACLKKLSFFAFP